MKILFTGASSFTGMWFLKELAKAGHQVTAAFLRPLEAYDGLRKKRVEEVIPYCRPIYNCPFGSESMLKLLKEEMWDMLCHHAADVTNYKSPSFDFAAALSSNTKNLTQVISLMKNKGCNRILLTGSVFEQNEGKGSDNLRAVSPYGLSKGLTFESFRYFCDQFEMKLGKFVIPNPFGPFEEPRFTTFLVRNWMEGSVPKVSSPDYIRDNIHASLLAKHYVDFAQRLTTTPGYDKCNPTGYQESQGDFTQRFAREMGKRLPFTCSFEIGKQTEFPEPVQRINSDRTDHNKLSWNEQHAWDDLAQFYLRQYGKNTQCNSGRCCNNA